MWLERVPEVSRLPRHYLSVPRAISATVLWCKLVSLAISRSERPAAWAPAKCLAPRVPYGLGVPLESGLGLADGLTGLLLGVGWHRMETTGRPEPHVSSPTDRVALTVASSTTTRALAIRVTARVRRLESRAGGNSAAACGLHPVWLGRDHLRDRVPAAFVISVAAVDGGDLVAAHRRGFERIGRRELLRDPEEGAGLTSLLADPPRAAERRLRLHRNPLQPREEAPHTRLSLSERVRDDLSLDKQKNRRSSSDLSLEPGTDHV